MKKYILSFFIILVLSCSKNANDKMTDDDMCPDYIKGSVGASIKNTAAIEEAFTLFNNLKLQLDEMGGFLYTSPYPKDSLSSINSLLKTKSYINVRGFSAGAYMNDQTGVMIVEITFFNMNAANQQDWIKTKNILKLIDTQGPMKFVLLKVPVGEEKSWVARLGQNSIVTWPSLVCKAQLLLE
jgi:hypothetical protein